MKSFYVFFFLLLIANTLSGQTGTSFGIELIPQLFLVELPEANTDASTRLSYGATLVGVADINLSDKLRLEPGVQLGFAHFSQRVIQQVDFFDPARNFERSLAAKSDYLHAGGCAFLKYAPLGAIGPYVKAGVRGQFNFSNQTGASVTDPDGRVPDDPVLFPGGEVDIPGSSLVAEIGIGFRFYNRLGLQNYLEISYARIPGNALVYAGPRDAVNRPNLLDTARAGSVNLTIGSRFGR